MSGRGVGFSRDAWGWLGARETEPNRIDTTFLQEEVGFAPDPSGVWRPANESLGAFRLEEVAIENNASRERTAFTSWDLSVPLAAERNMELQCGVKLRDTEREQDSHVLLYGPEDDVGIEEWLGEPGGRRIGPYELGPLPAPGVGEDIVRSLGLSGELSAEEEAGNFEASIRVGAVYGLLGWDLRPGVRFEAGARYELTDTSHRGLALTGEELEDLVPTRGSREYGFLMPSLAVSVEGARGTRIHASMSRTFARPDDADLVPRSEVDFGSLEIERGNPNLDPTESWNVDLSVSHTFGAFTIDGAAFFKDLDGFIYRRRNRGTLGEEAVDVIQPVNGGGGRLFGLELSMRQRIEEGPLRGLGAALDLLWASSRADVPERSESIDLPGQARWTGGLTVSYERERWWAQVHLGFVDSFLSEVGESPYLDLHRDDRRWLEAAGAVDLTSRLGLYVRGNDLLGDGSRSYQGSQERRRTREESGWSAEAGLSYAF